jgi:hypothetical protein
MSEQERQNQDQEKDGGQETNPGQKQPMQEPQKKAQEGDEEGGKTE